MFKAFRAWVVNENGEPYFEAELDYQHQVIDWIKKYSLEAKELNHKIKALDLRTGKYIK